MTQKLVFHPAKQNRIFEDVVQQIENAIVSGKLKDGDRLPPERELREMLQTSRSTIREALRVLEQKGLVEIKLGTGGGAVVKPMSSDTMVESLALLMRSRKVSLTHLVEFRERAESETAALAAMRRSAQDIESLHQLLDQAYAYVQKGSSAAYDFLQTDQDIHYAIAEITANPIYIFIIKTIHKNIHEYYYQYLIMDDAKLCEDYKDLTEIVKAVEEADGERAGSLVREHVRRFGQYMEEKQLQMKR